MTSAVVAAGYVVVAVISEGSFGTVLKASASPDNIFVAIKAVPKNRLSAKETAAIRKQALALRTLSHRYIVHFYDDFEDDDFFYHVFEYLHGGDLYDRLESRGKPFSEPQVLFLARQIFHAVSYLHSKRAAHRDIKLENFVFETSASDDRQVMKLIDFDLLIMRSRQSPRTETCTDMCGTILYVSPEIAAGREHVPEESDMWACGVLLYVLLSYQMPFQGATGRQILRAVRTTDPHFAPAVWAHVSAPTKNLVRNLLNKNAAERPTAEQALDRVRAIQAAGRDAGLPGFGGNAAAAAGAGSSRLRSALRGLRSVSLNLWDPAGNLVRRGGSRAAAAVAEGHNPHVEMNGMARDGSEWTAAFRPGDWRGGGGGGTGRRRRGERRSRSQLPADGESVKSPSATVSAASSLRSSLMLQSAIGSDGNSEREAASSSMSLMQGGFGRNSAMAGAEGIRKADGRVDDHEFATSPALANVWSNGLGSGRMSGVRSSGFEEWGSGDMSRLVGMAHGDMGGSDGVMNGGLPGRGGGDGVGMGVSGERDGRAMRASRRMRWRGGFSVKLRNWMYGGEEGR